jgi:hypothetical protein
MVGKNFGAVISTLARFLSGLHIPLSRGNFVANNNPYGDLERRGAEHIVAPTGRWLCVLRH